MTSSDPAVKEFLESVGLTVRLIRLGRRMSQDQVASAASVSRVTLGSIERAEHAATLVTYFRIAAALDVPLWRLVNLDPLGLRADSGGRRG